MIWFKEEDNELSFEANETIYVYVNYEGRYNLNEPWWYGEINRQGRGSVRGLFPSNYITVTDQVRQRYRIRTPTGMVQNKNFTKFFFFISKIINVCIN